MILAYHNYIKYINDNKIYITYNFPSVSQLMRILIAEELNYKDKFDWKKERFDENIISKQNPVYVLLTSLIALYVFLWNNKFC